MIPLCALKPTTKVYVVHEQLRFISAFVLKNYRHNEGQFHWQKQALEVYFPVKPGHDRLRLPQMDTRIRSR